ncbi:MAG: hypothetical protein NW207_05835 [Cytophagales bacterium]|nr:hypothetical protein [Cytophagales bacterium]
MKTNCTNPSKNPPLYLLILIWMLFNSSTTDYPVQQYEPYKPILVTRTVLETSIKNASPRGLSEIGKFYFKDNIIFIVEKYKGIHVINNSNPAKPENVTFIVMLGCIDICIKNNILYADNAVDLVGVDIADIYHVKEVSRERNVFPELTPPDGSYYYAKDGRPKNTVIIQFVKNDTYYEN